MLQNTFSAKTRSIIKCVVALTLLLPSAAIHRAMAQTPEALPALATPIAASSSTVVPMLVRYDGAAIQIDGKPKTGAGPVTFLIFKDEKGGEPLWTETQTVAFDPAGKYEVYLGATYSSGLPSDLFGSGEARWLEVQIAGEVVPPRTLLVSVPYAMNAATLGGLPPSAFVLASQVPASTQGNTNAISPDASSSNVTTTGGTKFYVPRFSAAATIVNSEIYDTGTAVGIGDTPNAGAKLDVNGAMIVRGNLQVTQTANATTSKGYPSYGFQFYSNVYNSSTKAGDTPYFQLQSEPAGNNTASPSATLNLLFANNGKAVAETGLYFNHDGTIHFAPTQTFPSTSSSSTGTALTGTSGSGTGVQGTSTSATGVAGTSTTGNGMLGYTSGSTLNTAGVLGGAGGPSGFGGIAGVWGDAYSHVGVLGTSQLYAGVQGISNYGQGVQGQSTSGFGVQGTSTTGYGVSGASSTSDGVVGSTGGSSLYTAGVLGSAGARTSFQAIAGVWGDAAAHVGVFGSSSQYAGVAGQSTQGQGVQGSSVSGVGVQGSSTSANGVYGFSSNTSGVHGETQSTSSGDAAVYGFSDSNAMGVYGGSNSGPGVVGGTASNIGVQGTASASGTAISGAAQTGFAGLFTNNSTSNPAVRGNNTGSGSAAVFTNSSASVPAVIGITYGGGANASAVAVYGDSAQSSGIGVEGNTLSGIGVYATTNAQSTGFQRSNFGGPVALWADSSPPNGDGEGIAIIATANGNNAGYFTNNSDLSTLYTVNYGSGDIGTDVFATLEAASPNGVCGFGGNGDLTCTGRMKSLATTGNGARTVETYSMQSPENWMEDFGSGTLRNGVATVSIDAAFAETVSGTSDYHVFLTPQGDSKGLYVTNKTAASFEVHESGGGTATIGFDYRIVAKRRGYEAQRMVDVTEAMKTVKIRNDLQTERYRKASKQ